MFGRRHLLIWVELVFKIFVVLGQNGHVKTVAMLIL